MDDDYSHRPVMLDEVLEALRIRSDGAYIDATFGRGGHADAILRKLGSCGRLVVMDKDPEAIRVANDKYGGEPRVTPVHGSFGMLLQSAAALGLMGSVDGLLLDLGVSSPQLDNPQRGFSFRHDGPLDMRMNPQAGVSAAAWLATAKEGEIATVLRQYGEERYARRIARAIVRARHKSPIATTGQLASIVAAANPSWERGKDPATRTFQALRIFINRELADLRACLKQALDVLAPQGRLVVISFHSLEHRIVKRFIRHEARGDDLPPGVPVTGDQIQPRLRAVGKAVYPRAEEILGNPRSRSAVLRVAEKIR